jgi:predicted DNA-binding transcriptional regulator AlpA
MQTDKLIHGFAGLTAKTTIARTTARRMLKAGTLPQPIKLTTRRVAWLESTIDAWLSSGGAKK